MPHYEFQCPNGHITGLFRSADQKPLTIECVACGEEAEPILSVPAPPVVKNGTPKHHGRNER